MSDKEYRWVLTTIPEIWSIRLLHAIIDRDDTHILVTFTLLDEILCIGSVEISMQEPSFIKIIEHLRTAIDISTLAFRVQNDSKRVMLRAAQVNSLLAISISFDQNGNEHFSQTPVRSLKMDINLYQTIQVVSKSLGLLINLDYLIGTQ